MGEALVGRYWCHLCDQVVNPVMEAELKCPFCDSGFVEEMDGREDMEGVVLGSDRSPSPWDSILLGMLGGTRERRRSGREERDDDSDEDRDVGALLRRRRRRSSHIFRLLEGIRENPYPPRSEDDNRSDLQREIDGGGLILINAFNNAVLIQASIESEREQGRDGSGAPLGDYFIGPGLEMLLQHLAENDPNRYGTPPARKEAVDALPTVKIGENTSCSVCLDDFEIGVEAREMPCRHKYHSGCILPWLELHSSCPICRYQLPADESKIPNGTGSGSREEGRGGDHANRSGDRRGVPVPWPFNGLFSGSQTSGNSSSAPSSSASGIVSCVTGAYRDGYFRDILIMSMFLCLIKMKSVNNSRCGRHLEIWVAISFVFNEGFYACCLVTL